MEWKAAEDLVKAEHKKRGYGGRFGLDLPAIRDGKMLCFG
jgi:type I restriction enzyme M protein